MPDQTPSTGPSTDGVTPPSDAQIATWWAAASQRRVARRRRRLLGTSAMVVLAIVALATLATTQGQRAPTQLDTTDTAGATSPGELPELSLRHDGLRSGYGITLEAGPPDVRDGWRQTPVVALQRLGGDGWYTTRLAVTLPPNDPTALPRICGFGVFRAGAIALMSDGEVDEPLRPEVAESCRDEDFSEPVAAETTLRLQQVYAGRYRLCRWVAPAAEGTAPTGDAEAASLICTELEVDRPEPPAVQILDTECPALNSPDLMLAGGGSLSETPLRFSKDGMRRQQAAGFGALNPLYDDSCRLVAYSMINADGHLLPEEVTAPDFDPLAVMARGGPDVDLIRPMEQSEIELGPPPGVSREDGTAVATIRIPRLGLQTEITEGVGPTGLGHLAISPRPGQPGNAILHEGNALALAVRGDPPALLRLEPGDEITVEAEGSQITFIVVGRLEAGTNGQAQPSAAGFVDSPTAAFSPDPGGANAWLGDYGDTRLTIVDHGHPGWNGGPTVVQAVAR